MTGQRIADNEGEASIMKRAAFLLTISLVAFTGLSFRAQMRVVPLDDEQGHIGLGLALRHLANTGIFMQATAHPDDEANGLLVMLNRGQGYRTELATATRGNGSVNGSGTNSTLRRPDASECQESASASVRYRRCRGSSRGFGRLIARALE